MNQTIIGSVCHAIKVGYQGGVNSPKQTTLKSGSDTSHELIALQAGEHVRAFRSPIRLRFFQKL
jgi:hypothetical protein